MGYDNLKLEKGMYRQEGMNFTQVLESLDPSENYRGTSLEKTDAFQRQLRRFGIKVKGPGSSGVEKFFRTTDSAVLFPEYIARTVRQGMEENDILPAITATTTVIDAMDYRSIYAEMEEQEASLAAVAEGTAIPSTKVRTRDNLISLSKRGRMLVASYEAVRFQKLDLFSVMLRQIGSYIQKMQLRDAIGVLVEGDGNGNAAEGFQPLHQFRSRMTVGIEFAHGDKDRFRRNRSEQRFGCGSFGAVMARNQQIHLRQGMVLHQRQLAHPAAVTGYQYSTIFPFKQDT